MQRPAPFPVTRAAPDPRPRLTAGKPTAGVAGHSDSLLRQPPPRVAARGRCRGSRCGLPPASSRPDTRPAPAPVNALPPPLRVAAHDSGPPWVANPSTYDSFFHYSPAGQRTARANPVSHRPQELTLAVRVAGARVARERHCAAKADQRETSGLRKTNLHRGAGATGMLCYNLGRRKTKQQERRRTRFRYSYEPFAKFPRQRELEAGQAVAEADSTRTGRLAP